MLNYNNNSNNNNSNNDNYFKIVSGPHKNETLNIILIQRIKKKT